MGLALPNACRRLLVAGLARRAACALAGSVLLRPAHPRRAPPPAPQVTLQHAGTKGFLHSYKHAAFGHPISGQREVCAVARGAKESEWFAAEGVYMPRADEPAGQQWRPQQRQGQQQQQSAGKAAPGKAGSAPSKAGAGAPRKGEPSNCTASTCDARDEL